MPTLFDEDAVKVRLRGRGPVRPNTNVLAVGCYVSIKALCRVLREVEDMPTPSRGHGTLADRTASPFASVSPWSIRLCFPYFPRVDVLLFDRRDLRSIPV